MFTHDAKIPTTFATAVHRIVHNDATYEDWETLDKYGRDEALGWIRSILQDNQTKNVEKEMEWWSLQLRAFDS